MPNELTICPSCNYNSVENKRFCTECGYALDEERIRLEKAQRIKELTEQKASSLKNTYKLLIFCSLPLIPVWISSNIEKAENETMMVCSWLSAIIIFFFLLVQKFSFKRQKKLSYGKWCLIALGIAVLMLTLNFSYHHILQSLLSLENETPMKHMLTNGLSVFGIFFYISLMPAIWEEFLFRGLLLKQLDVILSPIESAILSSIIFSAFHLSLGSSLYLAFLGYILVTLYRKSGSLIPCMLLHFIHNAVIVSYELYWL